MNTYSSVKSFDSQIQGRKLDSGVAIVSNQSRHHEPLQLNDNHLDQFTEAKTKKVQKLTQGVQGKPQSKPKVPIAKKAPRSPLKVKKFKKIPSKKQQTTVPKKKSKENDKKILDQQRRVQYGLGYLTEKQIKTLKQRSLQKQIVQVKNPAVKSLMLERSPEKIKQYIQTKKKQELQEKLQKRALTHIDQLRKEKNLLKLNESVKKIFKRVESPKFEIKKKEKADKLYDEYRQEIDEHLNKIRDEKSDKTIELKKKFQELTKRFNIVQEKEQPHIEEQVSEENYDQSIQDIDIINSEYLDKKIKQILEQQEFVDPDSLTAGDLQVLRFHYLNQAATMIQKVWKGYWMRKLFMIQLQEMFEEEERQQQLHMIDNDDDQSPNEHFQGHRRPQEQQFIEDSQQAQQFFFNPFNVGNAGPNEKQIHYSTIKSSIASEEEQKSFLQSSMVQHLQQELENWNSQIEQIISEKDASNFVQVKQKMQNQILSIVSQHFKKRRTSDHERNQEQQQQEHEQSVDLRRSQQEVQHEKSFNEARKKMQHSSEDLRQSPCQSDLNMNRSSLISLQGQLLKKENEILAMREDSIHLRYKAELKKTMTVEQKKEVELWLEQELEDLKKTKNAIEVSRKKEASALKKIQRDILIAQNYDDSPEAQQLQCKIDEQFSSLKKQDSIKVVDIFQDEVEHESFEEQQQLSDRDENMRLNMIESDKQIELYQTVSMMTGEILEEMIDQVSYEMLNHKDQFEIVIANLIASNQLLAGISTSPLTIGTYINSLISFAIERYSESIIERLNSPFGFDCLKRMRLIHGYEDDEYDQDYQDNQIAFVLDEQIFLEFEQLRLKDDLEDNYALKELEHIHNKAVFDACNEALNYYRPHYFNAGLPYPWDNKPMSLQLTDLSQPLANMTKRVLNWSKMFCGFLPVDNQEVSGEKQEILDEKNQQMIVQRLTQDPLMDPSMEGFQNPAFEQQMSFDFLSQLRDERLYRMLIQEIKDQEYKWYHFSDDKTEFLMEMADMIFETLVEEITSEL